MPYCFFDSLFFVECDEGYQCSCRSQEALLLRFTLRFEILSRMRQSSAIRSNALKVSSAYELRISACKNPVSQQRFFDRCLS